MLLRSLVIAGQLMSPFPMSTGFSIVHTIAGSSWERKPRLLPLTSARLLPTLCRAEHLTQSFVFLFLMCHCTPTDHVRTRTDQVSQCIYTISASQDVSQSFRLKRPAFVLRRQLHFLVTGVNALNANVVTGSSTARALSAPPVPVSLQGKRISRE